MAQIVGAHSMLYSSDPEADRAFLRDVLSLPYVDVGHSFVDDMKARLVTCSPPSDQGWGVLTTLTLPGGGSLGVYQPRHERPPSMA